MSYQKMHRLKPHQETRPDFWDVAMEQLEFWRSTGTCPRDCLAMLGRPAPDGPRPLWDEVLHELLIESARMHPLRVGGRYRRAA